MSDERRVFPGDDNPAYVGVDPQYRTAASHVSEPTTDEAQEAQKEDPSLVVTVPDSPVEEPTEETSKETEEEVLPVKSAPKSPVATPGKPSVKK